MPKWIFQKISGDQQGVSLIEENFNIGLAAQVAQKQKSCITKCNTGYLLTPKCSALVFHSYITVTEYLISVSTKEANFINV